jgi:hypothetical protein
MTCLQISNPASDFSSQHREQCSRCPEPAVAHFFIEYACGNVCAGHAKEMSKRKGCLVEQDVVIVRLV